MDDQDASLGDTTGLTDAERLRVVYEILTGPESDGGANISPNLDPYVESIMALHDDRFDKVRKKERERERLVYIFAHTSL